jgi:hypothetical protein
VQLTVVTPDRTYTVWLNALGFAVKADFLIEIKTCAWCRDQFVSAAAHQQFCKPACRKTAFREPYTSTHRAPREISTFDNNSAHSLLGEGRA